MAEQDRVSYSYGFKVPGAEQFSSVNVSVSLSTDVKAGETPERAMARAKAFVHNQAEAGSRPRQSPVQDELFDPSNPVHYRIAAAVFDAEGVTSERARAFKANNLLKGEPVHAIGEIVRRDQAEFRGQPFRVARNVGRDSPKSDWNGSWRESVE